jgi:ABC-type antimicrobial peptide transport system permease subunit
VGVVRNARERGLNGESVPTVYESSAQATAGPGVLIRTSTEPGGVGREAARIIHELDPRRPVVDVATLETSLAERVAPWRLNAILVGAFALLALVIAAVGIAGLLAFSVTQRTREFGIRMALGADRRVILRTVLGEGLALAVAGGAIGMAAAFALTRLLTGLLFGVAPGDPTTYAGAAVLLTVVAVTSALAPSLRATRVNPLVALASD